MDLGIAQPMKRPMGPTPMSPMTPSDATVHLSFNVPFSSSLPGPDPNEILHASPDALQRWTFPEGTDPASPTYKLPVHVNNLESLRRLCKVLSESSGGRVEAAVNSCEPKATAALQRRPPKGLVTNVCVSGDAETVHKMRAKILNETPIALVLPQWVLEEVTLIVRRGAPSSTSTRTSSSITLKTAFEPTFSSISTFLPSTPVLIFSF